MSDGQGRARSFTPRVYRSKPAAKPLTVDAVIEEARAAGGRIGREPGETFWGGYSGVFVDPDGHPWEVAHNPGWTVNDDGTITL